MPIMNNTKKKKILFLITKSNWGGAQRHVYDIATTLDQSLFDPIVALGGDGELGGKLAEQNIRTVKIPGLSRDISLSKEIKAVIGIAKIIRSEKPHILHVHSSKAGALGTFLGRVLRVPTIIFTAHGWAFNEERPYWQKFLLKFIHWVTVLMSHTTIAVSNAIKTQMNWPAISKKIIVINPGRTIEDLKPKDEARSILQTKITHNTYSLCDTNKDVWIGTIAELHPVKQLHRAVEAIALLKTDLPTIRYVLIGSGQCSQALQSQVARLQLQENVFFTGAIHEASRFMKAFDIFVLPSISEAYGYVLLEAGIAEVPVVASNVGGVPDIITHEKTGLLIPSQDTDALVDAIRNLIINKDLRLCLASNLHKTTRNQTSEKMTEKMTDIYQKTTPLLLKD
jgi:glycosyltransferase involved in cell wall biosynthesis